MREQFGVRSGSILRAVPQEIYCQFSTEIERLFQLAQDRGPQTASCLLRFKYTERISDIIELFERWGPEAWGFFRCHGKEAFELEERHRELYRKIWDILEAAESDDEFGVAVGGLSSALLEGYMQHVEAVLLNSGANAGSAFPQLHSTLLEVVSPHTLGKICRSSGLYIEASLLLLNGLISSHAVDASDSAKRDLNDFVCEISQHVGDTFPSFLKFMPETSYGRHREALVTLAQQNGKIAWALLKSLGERALIPDALHAINLKDVRKRFGSGAADYIAHVPTQKWDLISQQSLYSRYGRYAGRFYHQCEGLKEENSALVRLVEENQLHFGLRAIHRYSRVSDGRLDLSLLEDNLANLNPERHSNRPVALAVFGRECYNDALAQKFSVLKRIAGAYKLFVAEVGSPQEFIDTVMRIGQLHGRDLDGYAIRPIDLMLLGAHGHRNFIQFEYVGSVKKVDRSLHGPLLLPDHMHDLERCQTVSTRMAFAYPAPVRVVSAV